MDAQNRMILYYLNALGGGLAGKDHPMQQVGAVTEQQIKAESQMRLIQKLLDGGGTVKRGKTGGIDVSGDITSLLSGMSEEEKTPFAKAPSGTAMNAPGGQIETQRDLLRQDVLNPSPSLTDISGADLIGLTPENISQALQFKFASEELEHKKLSDIMKMLAPTPAAPIELPGVGKLSLKQWQALPSKERSYAYYVFTEEQRGDKPLEYDEWASRIDEPTAKQLYDIGKRDPEFAEWLTKYKKAGAIKIDIAGREIEKGLGKDIAYVTGPKISQDIHDDLDRDSERLREQPYVKKYMTQGMSFEDAQVRARKAAHRAELHRQLQIAYDKLGKTVKYGIRGFEVNGKIVQRY